MKLEYIPQNEFMEEALALAEEAFKAGEVPVGAVIVKDKMIVARGRNRREEEQNAILHAEIEAISNACRALNSWRLDGCELYVTLEPCPMCAGAALNARIAHIVYGADDERAGACGTSIDVLDVPLAAKPKVYRGLMEEKSKELLKSFFAAKR